MNIIPLSLLCYTLTCVWIEVTQPPFCTWCPSLPAGMAALTEISHNPTILTGIEPKISCLVWTSTSKATVFTHGALKAETRCH